MARISLTVETQGDIYPKRAVFANAAPGLGTIGIKRNVDNVVIVASGTDMTVAGGGVFTYDSTLLDPLVEYTAYIRVEFHNISDDVLHHWELLTASVLAISSATNLRSLRRKLMQRLGGYAIATTTGATDGKRLRSSTLADDELSDDTYGEGWIYVNTGDNAGQCARASNHGFIPEVGEIEITRTLANNFVVGVEFEWSSRLPAIQMGKMAGLREVINQALDVLWMISRETYPTVDGFQTDMNDYDWLRRASQIIQVEHPGSGTDWPISYAGQYGYRYDADRPKLIGPSVTQDEADDFRIAAYRPLSTWLKRGGVWQDANGLVDDADQALGDPTLITEVALFFAYKALSTNPYEGVEERKMWEAYAEKQSVIAANIKRQHSPEETDSTGLQWTWEPWSKEYIPVRRYV